MSWWTNVWTKQAEDWIFAWLGPNQVPHSAGRGEAAVDTDYLSVFLKSARVVNVRQGLTTFYGTVHSYIRLAHRSDGTAEFNVITTPAGLKNVDAAGIDRVVQLNQRLLGPVPYVGGDLEIELGLFSVPSGNLAGPYLELIQTLSETAGVAYVSAALPFAEPIVQGMKLLTHSQGAVSLEIGFSTTMPVPSLGYCVAIRAPKDAIQVDQLKVDPSDFRLIDATRAISRYPYIVVEVQAGTQRSDWFKIPELSAAYKAVQAEYRAGRQQGVEEALATFRRVALTCNDLHEADARQLVDKVGQTYARTGAPAAAVRGTGGGRANKMPDLSEIALYSP
jgi:hypothetical protein